MKPETENKKTILLIDSHASTRKAYGQLIHTDLGHKVLRTESADKAFEIFKRRIEKGKPIDMIISDLQRQDEVDGGIELCRKIRQYETMHRGSGRPAHIPFILQTHWGSVGQEKQLIDGKLRAANGKSAKALLVSKDGVKVLEDAIKAGFRGRGIWD